MLCHHRTIQAHGCQKILARTQGGLRTPPYSLSAPHLSTPQLRPRCPRLLRSFRSSQPPWEGGGADRLKGTQDVPWLSRASNPDLPGLPPKPQQCPAGLPKCEEADLTMSSRPSGFTKAEVAKVASVLAAREKYVFTTVLCWSSPGAVTAELKLGQKSHRKSVPAGGKEGLISRPEVGFRATYTPGLGPVTLGQPRPGAGPSPPPFFMGSVQGCPPSGDGHLTCMTQA